MAESTRIISVVGKKDCGKTTLLVALAAEFARKGQRVATIKHGTHPAKADHEGTDTWRHMHEGHADRVLIEAPGGRVFFERTEHESDPIALARHFMGEAEIVITEGFTRSEIPRVEVFRSDLHDTPHYDPSLPNADKWIAMLADRLPFDVPFPVFRFTDTAWLVTLKTMAWNAALPIDG